MTSEYKNTMWLRVVSTPVFIEEEASIEYLTPWTYTTTGHVQSAVVLWEVWGPHPIPSSGPS